MNAERDRPDFDGSVIQPLVRDAIRRFWQRDMGRSAGADVPFCVESSATPQRTSVRRGMHLPGWEAGADSDVRQAWRRKGIASALVGEAMALARRTGAARFWLSTGGHNSVAQALYESLGGDRKPLGDVNYWWSLD